MPFTLTEADFEEKSDFTLADFEDKPAPRRRPGEATISNAPAPRAGAGIIRSAASPFLGPTQAQWEADARAALATDREDQASRFFDEQGNLRPVPGGLGKALGRGVDQIQDAAYGLGTLAADLVGGPDNRVGNWFDRRRQANQAQMNANPAAIGSAANIGVGVESGAGGALQRLRQTAQYAMEKIGEQGPQVGLSAGGAVAARIAAARRLAQAGQISADAAARITAAAEVAGAAVPSVAQETGSMYSELANEGKRGRAAAATTIPLGAIAGFLDALEPVYAARRLAGQASGSMLESLLHDYYKGSRSRLGKAAMGAAEGVVTEAPTEYLQTGIEQANRLLHTTGSPDEFLRAWFSPEAEQERHEAGLAGGLVGAGFGGGASLLSRQGGKQPPAQPALNSPAGTPQGALPAGAQIVGPAGVQVALDPETPPLTGQVAVFIGTKGQAIRVQIGGASLDSIKEYAMRMWPGAEFQGVEGTDLAGPTGLPTPVGMVRPTGQTPPQAPAPAPANAPAALSPNPTVLGPAAPPAAEAAQPSPPGAPNELTQPPPAPVIAPAPPAAAPITVKDFEEPALTKEQEQAQADLAAMQEEEDQAIEEPPPESPPAPETPPPVGASDETKLQLRERLLRALEGVYRPNLTQEQKAAAIQIMQVVRTAWTKRFGMPKLTTSERLRVGNAAGRSGDKSEETQLEQPQPSPSQLETTPAKKKVKVARGISVARRRFNNETEEHGEDILSWIIDSGKMMSKKAARTHKGDAWWKANKSLYDSAPTLSSSTHHNQIYGGGRYPDQVAAAAYDAGRLQSPDVNALWEAIIRGSAGRKGNTAAAKSDEAHLNAAIKELQAWEKATEEGAIHVAVSDLAVGDVMDVEGERTEVVAIDPDTGEVTLKDGRRFGTQVVQDGTSIWVEKLDPADQEDFSTAEPPEPSPPEPAPKPPKDIPERVIIAIRRSLQTLREAAAEIDRVRQSLNHLGAERYVQDVLINWADQIKEAKRVLMEFRRLAPGQGHDAEAVIASLGGETPLPAREDSGFKMDAPEAPAEMTAREAAEKAANEARREEQAKKDKLLEGVNKPLTGTSGNLGQGDLLAAPNDLWAPPVPKPAPAPASPAFGSNNVLVSKERAEELKRLIKEKLRRTSAGVDPTLLANLIELGAYYLEAGVRSFPAWSAQLLEDLGEDVRPWLRSVYEGGRAFPGATYEDNMDPPERVKQLHKSYVAGANPNLERAGGGAGPAPQEPGTGDIQNDQLGQGGRGDGPVVGSPDANRPGLLSPLGAGGDLPSDAGQRGDSGLPDQRPSPGGPAAKSGERAQSPGGGRTDESGPSIESQSDLGTQGIPKIAPDAPSVADGPVLSASERQSLQRQAEGVAYISGDLENIRASLPLLFAAQQEDVLQAERRFFKETPTEAINASPEGLGDPKRGILFTNGTGTGKTFTGAGIVKRFLMQGKGSILIVAPNKGVIDEWLKATPMLGIDAKLLPNTNTAGEGVTLTTYANLRNNDKLLARDFDLVVMDEAHHILSNEAGEFTAGINAFRHIANHADALDRKAKVKVVGPFPLRDNFPGEMAYHDAIRAWDQTAVRQEALVIREKERLRGLNTRTVFLSATPFAYHKSLQLVDGYLYELPPEQNTSAYNTPRGFDRLLVESFGYRMRTGKLTQPDVQVRVDLMEIAFNEAMAKKGALSGRIIDVPTDYSREFILVNSELGQTLDDGFTYLGGLEAYREMPGVAAMFREQWDYLRKAQLLEALKMTEAIPRIRQHIAMGRKVILFHTYLASGTSVHPFRLNTYDFDARSKGLTAVRGDAAELDRQIAAFETAHPDWLGLTIPRVDRSLLRLQAEFDDAIRFYNGEVSTRLRAEAKIDFQKDDSPVKIICAQLQAGKEGVSLHDTTGKHPRVVMMAALPTRPTDAIQAEGRAYRIGVLTHAIYEYLALHSLMERFQFGSRINEKVSTVETLALGNQSRTLKERFRDAYLNPTDAEPNDQQGIGGKEADRRQAQASDWEKAIAAYFGRMKKNSRTKAAEGIDYFATPEPLGLKMVEWARPRTGEHALEPSAGHGAIARFFPETVSSTYVEPSAELRSELGVKVGSGRIVAGTFENLDNVNKFDVIVMNPPFGHGGAMAMRHLAKAAWFHLRNGGRIVALIPEGPSADAAFERFMEHEKSAHLYVRRIIGLGRSTFERAGTSVKTRIVIIDRSDTTPLDSEGRVDLGDDENINTLFESIQDMESIERPVTTVTTVSATVPVQHQAPAPAPAPKNLLSAAMGWNSIRARQTFVAKMNLHVDRAKFSQILAIAKAHKGYWSSFRGGLAIPGFQFTTATERDNFMVEVQGEAEPLPANPTVPTSPEAAASALLDEVSNSPAAEKQADKADERLRGGMRIDPKGGGEAGFIINPAQIIADLLVAGARLLRRAGQWTMSKGQWIASMVKTYGGQVSKYLNGVWARLARIQNQQANQVGPVAQGHLNAIEVLAGRTNIPLEQQPAYSAETLAKGKPGLATTLQPASQQIRILGSEELLRAKQRRDVIEATQAAAVKSQSDQLWRDLVAAARAANPLNRWGLPDWLIATPRARAFKERALHIAARLNAVGRKPDGSFAFTNFVMRAGQMSPKTAAASQLAPGAQFQVTNPVTGQQDTFTLGPLVTPPTGAPFYQLLRSMDAATQAEIYDHFAREYPDMIWFLDMFIDPALANTRTTINGIEIPVFNRFAAATMMSQGHPNFSPLDAYTPDVLVTRSLVGAIRGALSFRAGTKSPGRKYKSGTSREGGNVRDLLAGFNIRTWQMLAEKSRQAWMRAVLQAATPIRKGQIPEGWVKVETGMDDLWQAARRLRRWQSPVDPVTGLPLFPETQTRLGDDGSAEYKAFFGEAAVLRGKQLMLPKALVALITARYSAQVEHGRLYRLGAWLVRNSVGLYLVAPTTWVANVLTNDLFAGATAVRRIMSGIAGANAQDLRFAREVFIAEAFKWFPGLRRLVDRQFRDTVDEVLPDGIFTNQTALADLKIRLDEDPLSYLRQGEIAAAALQFIRYGRIDIVAKQRMAYAWLRAQAVSNARRAGLRGAALRASVDRYLRNPPVDDRAQATEVAGFELLNYADSPAWLEKFSDNIFSKLILPFPRFGYHYLYQVARRASAVRDLVARVPARRRAEAFADFVTFLLFPAGGAGLLAYALAGDDDDDEARKLVGTSQTKRVGPSGAVEVAPMDRSLVTANRINLTGWARQLGLGDPNREEDFWLRVRSYPIINMAGAAILAMADARKLGAQEGALTYARATADLASDFFSVGMAARLPDKAFQALRDRTGGRNPPQMVTDPYGTRVPFLAYLTDQTLDSFVPGVRQADIMIRWIDPVMRRRTSNASLRFEPTVWDAARVGHWTGLVDRLLSPGGESTLPPEGPVKRGYVQPTTIPLSQRLSELSGFNLRPINRARYEEALRLGE